MRVLIAYATRQGAAEKAARLLAGYFEDADVVNLAEKKPDPSEYDAVIFGSGIRSGRIYRPLEKWLSRYWAVLRDMTKGVYICNALLDKSPEYLKANFSLELRNTSVVVEALGGEFDRNSVSVGEKLMNAPVMKILMSREAQEFVPCLLTDRIRLFAEEMKEHME